MFSIRSIHFILTNILFNPEYTTIIYILDDYKL